MLPFTRDQLKTVVSVMFRAAADQFQSSTPPTITRGEYLARIDLIGEYLHGVQNTLGASISILYATVTGEGLGIGDFPQFQEFATLAEQFNADDSEDRTFPDTDHLAAAVVDHLFGEYLPPDHATRVRLAERAIGEYEFVKVVEHRGQWDINSDAEYTAYTARVQYQGGGTDVFSVKFKPNTNTVMSAETLC